MYCTGTHRTSTSTVQVPGTVMYYSIGMRSTRTVPGSRIHESSIHDRYFGEGSPMSGFMADRSVSEWVARKATHATDPFSAELPPPAAAGAGAAVAVFGNETIAKSTRVQKANNRVYFPMQDCKKSAFTLSDKRWR